MTRLRELALTASVIVTGLSATASAHFKLNAPASLSAQDALGDPQKTEPCGQDDGEFVLTNATTTYKPGSTITISINETIFHPGHYRVSLAQNRAALPPDPPHVGGTQCNSTAINANPVLPLLADGLLVHTSSFGSATKTVDVQLPAGMTCTDCVLQVTQFMSSHGAPCFYHHCATVTISDTAPAVDAGVTPSDSGTSGDAGNPSTGGGGGGCSSGAGAGLLAALGLVGLRRRRR